MQNVIITNINNGFLLADKGRLANSFFTRLKGLLGKKSLPQGFGLIIQPCNMVHSIGMKMAIDVLFVSPAEEIIYIIEAMPPNRISPYIHNAGYVIELPTGQVQKTATAVGNTISISQGANYI